MYLKSAYNTVNRKTLFSFIQKDVILNQSESVFLENLYDSIYLKTEDNRKHYFPKGVPQGATLSPLFFNIKMDNVLKTLVSGFSDISKIYKKAYADDVVFILKQKHLN